METKADIRNRILDIREAMPTEKVEAFSETIAEHLFSKIEYKEAEAVFLFLSIRNEVRTKKIWEDARKNKKRVYAPKIIKGNMEFYELTDEASVKEGYFRILEPIENTPTKVTKGLMLLPGSVFDFLGNRIGYGKGFYDTYLTRENQFKKIALAYSFQVLESIPAEEYDIRVEEIVTEQGSIIC